MSLKKDTGIVLSAKLIGEADALLSVLGEKGPKLKYRLRGIKKSKTRPIITSEIGSYIHLDYYVHENEEIHNIKEVNIINRFDSLKNSYGGFLVLNYFCEIMNTILPDGENHGKPFELLFAALNAMEENGYKPLIIPFFKIKLLILLGMISREFHCHLCESEITDKKGAALNRFNLEITCSDCLNPESNQIHIVKFMDLIAKSRYKNLSEAEIPSRLFIETDQILNDYLRGSLNIALKSYEVLYKSLGINYEISY